MIITGAPVETMEFSDVTYWKELCDIFDWAKDHVFSSLFIYSDIKAERAMTSPANRTMVTAKMYGRTFSTLLHCNKKYVFIFKNYG